MPLGRLHVVVGIADDVGLGEVGGAAGAVDVLSAAEPDRIAIGTDENALVDVERPAVIAGQPGHVGRIGDDDHIHPGRLHGLAGPGDPAVIFCTVKSE